MVSGRLLGSRHACQLEVLVLSIAQESHLLKSTICWSEDSEVGGCAIQSLNKIIVFIDKLSQLRGIFALSDELVDSHVWGAVMSMMSVVSVMAMSQCTVILGLVDGLLSRLDPLSGIIKDIQGLVCLLGLSILGVGKSTAQGLLRLGGVQVVLAGNILIDMVIGLLDTVAGVVEGLIEVVEDLGLGWQAVENSLEGVA